MGKRTFMLSRPGGIACLALLAISLVVTSVVTDPVSDETKKPEEPSPAVQPAPEKQTNAIQQATGELTGNSDTVLPSNSNAAADAATAITEEVRTMIKGAIEELRQYVGESSQEILERTTRNADELSRKVDQTLSARLDLVQRSLAQNQRRHLDALRDANHSFLMQAGIFGGLGFLGVLLAAVVLARAINRFSKVALSLPGGLVPVNTGGLKTPVPAEFEQASGRFAETVDRLLKRIEEWEQLMGRRFAAEQNGRSDNGRRSLPNGTAAADSKTPLTREAKLQNETSADARSEVSVLLGKGHALLNLGKVQEAINCFDKAIALDSGNPGAFVQKGLALEKLQKMDQAIENYDRAIALDDSLTLAYLYKGAVFGKLQRFQEALACYEKALKAEQKLVAV